MKITRKNKRIKNRRTLVKGGSYTKHIREKINDIVRSIIDFLNSYGINLTSKQKEGLSKEVATSVKERTFSNKQFIDEINNLGF